jgi:hypothetical protein
MAFRFTHALRLNFRYMLFMPERHCIDFPQPSVHSVALLPSTIPANGLFHPRECLLCPKYSSLLISFIAIEIKVHSFGVWHPFPCLIAKGQFRQSISEAR